MRWRNSPLHRPPSPPPGNGQGENRDSGETTDSNAQRHGPTCEPPGGCERWRPPEFEPAGANGEATAERLRLSTFEPSAHEKMHRIAYFEGLAEGRDEGHRLGRQEGLSDGRAELRDEADHFRQLMLALARPLEQVDEKVERLLVMLAMTVARQLVRRELKTEPGQVVAAVREAVSALPNASRAIQVHLHPEDAALVRAALDLNSNTAGPWEIVEDPVLTRGGCRVAAEDSHIDATVENRLAVTIAKVLGGERRGDIDA